MRQKTKTQKKPGAARSFGFLYPLLTGLLLLVTLVIWFVLQRSEPTLPLPEVVSPPKVTHPVESTSVLVDEGQCQGCHTQQFKDWRGSHHQLAMQEARDDTVLGDFGNRTLKEGGETTRFYRKDSAFWVNTPGPDGKPADFRVAYTFGVTPLQQYLLELPGGRLQALSVAWDVERGRWFHLYPGQNIDFKDELHWSKPQQNANFVCIECHTTGFKRNFNALTESYSSHWQALGVGCQSCHGPASDHLKWASNQHTDSKRGFDLSLTQSDNVTQVETCGRCHARRAPLGDGFQAHKRLMDDYLPSPLTQALYELDGKIKDEVFEWGSFTQSKMFSKGVRCSNCHNPHSGELKASGNGVCLQCHNPAGESSVPGIDDKGLKGKNSDSPEHHQHPLGKPGSQCIDCHMPGKLYMGNDFRHDHSFTLPNPARALKMGTPDACLGCHKKDATDKILQQFQIWYGSEDKGSKPRYDESLRLIRNGLPGASQALLAQLDAQDLPAIRRATLLAELSVYPSERAQSLAVRDLHHGDPLVRRAAVEAVSALLPPQQQVALLGPVLDDPVRAVRFAAANSLSSLTSVPLGQYQTRWDRAIGEYESTQQDLADRAEANLNLAMLYQTQGRTALVEPALRDALRRNPDFLPAIVSLAQWLEGSSHELEAHQLLDDAISAHPQAAMLYHAKGLALFRQKKREAGINALGDAARLAPDDATFSYVYAIALHDSGNLEGAIENLERLLKRQPSDREARMALIAYYRKAGQLEKAQVLQSELKQINPGDPAFRQE
ncbi:tetratricopeptide repeat protein [Pseudomonas sp. CG7]|uniref:tetratricopeptide repeat protein n=1 Tax=Pseudomonas sp. CG7 TaxID=191007 RepID=UPI002034399C|nr:tetratricopeptide repeat protein [Pseudomonas sp. CG7]MCM2459321.1 tetratricopeptide repeat protein [Pseudomonas sp. CG7]